MEKNILTNIIKTHPSERKQAKKIMLTLLKNLFTKKKPPIKQYSCYSLTCPFTAKSEEQREQHYQEKHE